MAKRGYKLQEFVAHSGNVNCLRFGKKTCRMFLTGGDDHSVNLWSIGKPTSTSTLSGHTSPVESIAFDSAEILVAAGSSSGLVKLWDLEDTKMIRTLSGHRSYCTALEFHPFGEFFASGSMDTNLKIWDIRKKGCIHTYKGHTRGISTIRFTPDGRWVVSGGFDNVVKIWDLTAGKLLHDFKFHEGHIRSIDFHPLEFLLATGSADRTVKFWDLETFEMIGSVRREATGVRSIAFHPDGRTLFCGLDDSLKVYSWEPVICHDSIDMGWSTLGDLCIHDGKLLGGTYYQNSVGVWVADISLIEPYGMNAERNSNLEQKREHKESTVEMLGSNRNSNSSLRCSSPDFDSKEIKNIYVDSEDPVTTKKVASFPPPEVIPSPDPKESDLLSTQKQNSVKVMHTKPTNNKSFIAPVLVPHDSPDGKDFASSRRETISTTRASAPKPSHLRRPSNNFDMEKTIETELAENVSNENDSTIKNDEEKSEKTSLQSAIPDQGNGNAALESTKGLSSVKVVNGVAVVRGRTRSLVERFERREISQVNDASSPETVLYPKPEEVKTSPLPVERVDRTERSKADDSHTTDTVPHSKPEETKPPPLPVERVDRTGTLKADDSRTTDTVPRSKPEETKPPPSPVEKFNRRERLKADAAQIPDSVPRSKPEPTKTPPSPVKRFDRRERLRADAARIHNTVPHSKPEEAKRSPLPVERFDRRERLKAGDAHSSDTVLYFKPEEAKETPLPITNTQIVGRDETAESDNNIIENLMQNHDILLSTFRSRLTKLQVVRHFWERNDIKGAINALKKLPDHSVQADVVSVLIERMEVITLDLFSSLLPVLLALLDSKIERHANVSLEMLLKLVAIFGPMVRSAASARPSVGVDLHAEQRIECCRQCLAHLQIIQKIIPTLIQRGGLVAKSALQLNLVLQQ
ncbi:katanin p80 WD40 repeat-containing subunit B1 homolog isoform X1 [Ipomoea triloba]|uniref:katanin p80 WD40 repeat-containing subunit B1 homolog isoform X1 n=2 Tax=Ipomoea triloba TaxID=35885 RepID=UPI00125CFDFE|nr:katanin p80 WD40 repeat-containing subunit B1 homolog isoform X1 [Ipomoea triloba]XP_031127861.1 katanin p80 WD40 repeat-containing subunit B1 homolog isoform X1 [Ipomoea triloba]